MKPTILYDQYIVLDRDGDPMFSTVTNILQVAISCHFADATPISTKEAAIKAGYKLIKCDIVLTNIKEVI